jgi:hypothetical protein
MTLAIVAGTQTCLPASMGSGCTSLRLCGEFLEKNVMRDGASPAISDVYGRDSSIYSDCDSSNPGRERDARESLPHRIESKNGLMCIQSTPTEGQWINKLRIEGQSGSVIFVSGTRGPRDTDVGVRSFWTVGTSSIPTRYQHMDVAQHTTGEVVG